MSDMKEIVEKMLQKAIDEAREVTIIILNGYQMKGKVKEWDGKAILFEEANGKTSVIFLHAISTIQLL